MVWEVVKIIGIMVAIFGVIELIGIVASYIDGKIDQSSKGLHRHP